jgi:hypothetical protein
MLQSAINHFNEDITRANELLNHSMQLQDGVVKDDIMRAAIMMCVGASDAYFSDAYTDVISRAIRAKELEPAIQIPDRLNNTRIPVAAILRDANGGWRWRMAAKELMEDENVLSLEKIRTLFNHFFRKGHKVVSKETIEDWIVHPDARYRMFKISAVDYSALTGTRKASAKDDAFDAFEGRYEAIFQRRHDCIHCCDRPKYALQGITRGNVLWVIHDIRFLVNRCHDALIIEFPIYLRNLAFCGATIAQVIA